MNPQCLQKVFARRCVYYDIYILINYVQIYGISYYLVEFPYECKNVILWKRNVKPDEKCIIEK